MMDSLRNTVQWKPGTMWLCNHPSYGGTHLPDFTLVAPVYEAGSSGRLLGYVANRAHHADIGGMAPGSLSNSSEVFHEGLIIPPTRLVVKDRMQDDVLVLVCSNSRAPDERRGDLAAQVAANHTGIRRLSDLATRYGLDELDARSAESRAYSEAAVTGVLSLAPEGEYHAQDVLDDDGQGTLDLLIRVGVSIRDSRIRFDFTGTAPETTGSINATEAVTRSACYYVLRCLVDEEIPMNSGAYSAVEVIAPSGSLVNARFPRAVAAGNVETSQRIVDVLLTALAEAFPDRIPAASQGTMNNLLIGGPDPVRGRGYAYYETLSGGAGGSPQGPGASAVHTHMTNTRNTPIEALEMHYPLRVKRYEIRANSGGDGDHPGGDGIIREIELLAASHVSIVSERRRHPPPGLRAKPGSTGENRVRMPDRREDAVAAKSSEAYPAGTVVTIWTPGGGGWNPTDRSINE
jgi:N-methylhydantoinase B